MGLHVAYRTVWLSGIAKANSTFVGGVLDWLSQGEWGPSRAVTKRAASLSVFDSSLLSDAFGNDFIRLSMAAFESAASVVARNDEPRSCAWQIISYYYAAYYAANALMRLSGVFSTNLGAGLCAEVNERALLYGVGGVGRNDKVSPGVYYGTFTPSGSPELSLRSLAGVSGGVHIQFWCAFLRFLEALLPQIAASPLASPEKAAARQEVAVLKLALSRGGKQQGSWLSEVRNAVNYRLEGGVWFPYSASFDGHDLRRTLRLAVAGQVGIPSESAELADSERLTFVSGYLLNWVRRSAESLDLTARHGKRSRLRAGILEVCSTI